MNFLDKFSKNSVAIFLIILSCFLLSVIIAIVRHLSQDFHPFFIIFMRNLFAFLLFLPMIFKNGIKIFKTSKLKLHIFRGVNGLVGMSLWFLLVTMISLPELVSFTFLVPIITTFFALFFLKEKVKNNIWIALLTGFIGVLLIIRPGFKEFNYAYLLVLLMALTWSITNLLIKLLTKTEKSGIIVFYMTFIMFIFSIPFAFIYYQQFGFYDFLWFFMLGILSNLSHIAISHAYSEADLSILQPFDFTRLIFTSIIAYFVFGEVLDFYTFLGALIIISGSIFVASKRKSNVNKIEAEI